MATIITVHGTGASGPAEAEEAEEGHWWQRNSFFVQHMRDLVEAKDGELKVEPLLWDGKNSEASRHKASEDLHSLVKSLEIQNETYCLVGHSHGGSVISNTAIISSKSRRKLLGWNSWITVGTPFVHMDKHFFLFSRLYTPARAAYMILVLYSIAAVLLPLYFSEFSDFATNVAINGSKQFIVRAGLAVVLLIPAILGFYFISYLQPKKLQYFNRRQKAKVREEYQDNWIGLWHADDEAVQGLKRLHHINIRPFSARFAASSITFLAIFILPTVLLLVSLNDQATDWLIRTIGSEDGPINDAAREGGFIERFVSVVFVTLSAPVRLALPGFEFLTGMQANSIIVLIVGLTVGIFFMWLVALAIYIPFKRFAEFTSRLISHALNSATQKQVNKSALGSDTVGETALYAMEHPFWMEMTTKPLPIELADEISAMSNEAAANSIAKIRDALSKITFSEKFDETTGLLADYLTWKELVHTTYFQVPRFRKLVAYAISQTEGFRPSEKFRSDVDFEIVKNWYQEIKLLTKIEKIIV